MVAFLQGTLAGYPGSGPDDAINFSPSDILETMDTSVLDEVQSREGDAALRQVEDTIAGAILATLREEYPNQLVLVPLDAGHGGDKAYFWDPGSNGTEALHTRAVVAALLRMDQSSEYQQIILRPIFDDEIPETFGMPGKLERPIPSSILIRQVRASMLAREAAAWNAAHPDRPVAVHELSVHFNSGAGGALVLHEGDSVKPAFASRSIDFGKLYLHRVVTSLNATGFLPAPLRLWGVTGLHDDVMMYRPTYLNGANLPTSFVPRYGELQGNGFQSRYVKTVLANAGAG